MSNNNNLTSAKKAKNDEFYTQLSDIEKELQHYTEHFKNKVVLCNCNDANYGYFSQYFVLNFAKFELKELICTSYGDNSKVFFYHGELNEKSIPDINLCEQYDLKENGDFRSNEMIELLKRADIVCTNPPFSLFREYVAQLMEYNKKFLIIGNMNAITHEIIFPLIRDNLIWLGVNTNGHNMTFICDGDKKDVTAVWYTNLDHSKRHKSLDLYKHYNKEEYPKYDNYDAIEVNKVSNIPMDYNEIMGVPITFLENYCPTQFEIVGCTYKYGIPSGWDENTKMKASVNGKNLYKRLLIKKI